MFIFLKSRFTAAMPRKVVRFQSFPSVGTKKTFFFTWRVGLRFLIVRLKKKKKSVKIGRIQTLAISEIIYKIQIPYSSKQINKQVARSAFNQEHYVIV